MIQRIWYYALRAYVWAGLHFYFQKIIVKGRENIPTDHPVLFTPNHQNAFIDALLVVTTNYRHTHFLTRADVFKKGFVHWLLSTLNLIPVYRMRDGWSSLDKNQETFTRCTECFEKNECVLIFPEGNHGMYRRLRPLSKGFTRVVFEALQKNSILKLSIVPVGLNYTSHTSFFGSVSIYYGKPIPVAEYFNQPQPQGANELRHAVATSLKELITHVADEIHYAEIIRQLEHQPVNYLDPIATNTALRSISVNTVSIKAPQKRKKNLLVLPLYYFLIAINYIPLLWWKKIANGIKDPVFISSLKFAFGIFIFPVFYFMLACISLLFTSPVIAISIFAICLFTLPGVGYLRKFVI